MSTTAVASSPACTIRAHRPLARPDRGPAATTPARLGGDDSSRDGDVIEWRVGLTASKARAATTGSAASGRSTAGGDAGSDTLRGGPATMTSPATPARTCSSPRRRRTAPTRCAAAPVTTRSRTRRSGRGQGDPRRRRRRRRARRGRRRLQRRGRDGGAGADQLLGSGADEALAGLGGDDVLDGGAGVDAYLAGAGNDAVRARDAAAAHALISCGSGRDTATVDDRDPRASACEASAEAPKADRPSRSRTRRTRSSKVRRSSTASTSATPARTPRRASASPRPSRRTRPRRPRAAAAPRVPSSRARSRTSRRAARPTARSASVTARPGRRRSRARCAPTLPDPNAANDSATETTIVEPKPAPAVRRPLRVTVADDLDPAAVLQEVHYTVAVTNAGPLAADAVSLVLDIDESWSAIARPSGCTQYPVPDHQADLHPRVARGGRDGEQGARRELGARPALRRSRQPSRAAPPTPSRPTTPRPRRPRSTRRQHHGRLSIAPARRRSRAVPASSRANAVTVVRNRHLRRQREELAGVGAGQVRDGAQHPLLPQVGVGEGGDVGHVDAGAHDRAAWRDGAQRGGTSAPTGAKIERGVERLGAGRHRVARPLGAERARAAPARPCPRRG